MGDDAREAEQAGRAVRYPTLERNQLFNYECALIANVPNLSRHHSCVLHALCAILGTERVTLTMILLRSSV